MTKAEHVHDMRVDPSQVITMDGTLYRVRIVCVGCRLVAMVHSTPDPVPHPERKETWRKYRAKDTDKVKVLPETVFK